MIRILFAIVCAGGGIFLLQSYVQPALVEVENLRKEQEVVTDTIDKAREVIRRRDELSGRYNSIASADIEKVRRFLPAGSAISELLVDMDVLAKEAEMNVRNISFVESENATDSTESKKVDMQTLVVTVGIEGTYEDFQEFLMLLERNLRLLDVVRIGLKGQSEKAEGLMQFEMVLKAYYQDRTIL